MKIFLDANILISVLNKEYPLFSYNSRVLSLTDSTKFKIFTSPLCLSIAYYFAEKKHGNIIARHKIKLLSEKLNFTTINAETVYKVEQNKKIHDFEDGLQYYSAMHSDCKCIVTDDKNDFYFSEIEIINGKSFLEKYVF